MTKAYKYRLWTNDNQERELDIALETHRRLYNEALAQRKTAYETSKTSIKFKEQAVQFTVDKRTNPWYARLNHSSAQQTLRRLDKAFQAFFRRIKSGDKPGYPRFKGQDAFNSIAFVAGDGIQIKGDKLYVQHVGLVRVKWHRPLIGKIKQVVVKREAGHWYAVFFCEIEEVVEPSSNQAECGIDVGLTYFLTDSEGWTVDNPRFLKGSLPELRRAQRSLSRKKKGSRRRRLAKTRVRQLHQKVKNQRSDFHWKTANELVNRHGKIAAESLNVRGMMGNRRLARSIADAGWFEFLLKLKSKAESAGVLVLEVNCRGTSQVCSRCGEVVPKTLSDRRHECGSCGLSIDRDFNSALEILNRGRAAWAGPSGVKVGVG